MSTEKTIQIGFSDDYASVDTKSLRIYYGYEVTSYSADEGTEWAFEIKRKHRGLNGEDRSYPLITIGRSQIIKKCGREFNTCEEFLAAGIAIAIDEEILVIE